MFNLVSTFLILTALAQTTPAGAEEVVQRLAELGPGGLSGRASAPGSAAAIREELRQRLYTRLGDLGDAAVPALSRGLGDPNVLIRRNVALFLAAGRFAVPSLAQSRLNGRLMLPALIGALKDNDATVRGWAAQAIGGIGRDAAEAVPALIVLLANEDEGSRNSACIALRGIGPAAKDALPSLRQALSDPSANVRSFATRAIQAIEGQ